MVPKPKSSNAGNSNVSKRRHKILPLNVKVKVLHLIREGKTVIY
jgi:hypothetical protein